MLTTRVAQVTVLSRLNHPHVVRYFASWIEDGISTHDHEPSDSSDDNSISLLTNTGHGPVLPASSRGLDFISSTNAQIIFADNGDNGDDNSDEDENSSSDSFEEGSDIISLREESGHTPADDRIQMPSRKDDVALSGAAEKATWTILYIQMEYCKQETLRDLINTGLQANPIEVWRLFRQIVQGLAHIHGLAIVHRDLKPENVFIDSDGDVRIGDFGLARPGDYRTIASRAPTTGITQREVFGSFTKDVGTASYVAPEVRSAGNGKYNEKADMFSLGVILLEMNVPFSTGMERAETLAQLQKENHTLPAALDFQEKTTQVKHLFDTSPRFARQDCGSIPFLIRHFSLPSLLAGFMCTGAYHLSNTLLRISTVLISNFSSCGISYLTVFTWCFMFGEPILHRAILYMFHCHL